MWIYKGYFKQRPEITPTLINTQTQVGVESSVYIFCVISIVNQNGNKHKVHRNALNTSIDAFTKFVTALKICQPDP